MPTPFLFRVPKRHNMLRKATGFLLPLESVFCMNWKSPILWFFLSLIAVVGITLISPPEATLGVNARVVYLHGAWVWTSLAAFVTAGIVGLLGLILRRENLHHWSRAVGRTGLFFWITYLPISLWAMQTNWNGLFLAEPRWLQKAEG